MDIEEEHSDTLQCPQTSEVSLVHKDLLHTAYISVTNEALTISPLLLHRFQAASQMVPYVVHCFWPRPYGNRVPFWRIKSFTDVPLYTYSMGKHLGVPNETSSFVEIYNSNNLYYNLAFHHFKISRV